MQRPDLSLLCENDQRSLQVLLPVHLETKCWNFKKLLGGPLLHVVPEAPTKREHILPAVRLTSLLRRRLPLCVHALCAAVCSSGMLPVVLFLRVTNVVTFDVAQAKVLRRSVPRRISIQVEPSSLARLLAESRKQATLQEVLCYVIL